MNFTFLWYSHAGFRLCLGICLLHTYANTYKHTYRHIHTSSSHIMGHSTLVNLSVCSFASSSLFLIKLHTDFSCFSLSFSKNLMLHPGHLIEKNVHFSGGLLIVYIFLCFFCFFMNFNFYFKSTFSIIIYYFYLMFFFKGGKRSRICVE